MRVLLLIVVLGLSLLSMGAQPGAMAHQMSGAPECHECPDHSTASATTGPVCALCIACVALAPAPVLDLAVMPVARAFTYRRAGVAKDAGRGLAPEPPPPRRRTTV